ncbi:MAG TPA: UDP-glucose 4-epimerase GalE [Coriobacteriia bacterium]
MRVLVTGGAGYIGSVTVRTLLDAGHAVTVLDTLEKGWGAAVDARAALEIGSVGDRAALDRVLPGCDAVMHLAGYIEVAESQADPDRYFTNNVSAPQVMLDAMADHGVDALVFSSTAAVYGRPADIPIREDAETLPINAYGESKLAFEKLLEASAGAAGIRSIRFRYFNAAGAWPDGSLGEAHRPETHLIPSVLTAMRAGTTRFEVFGGDYDTPDGTCVRDYVHVWDLARAHEMALEHLFSGGGGAIWNLGNGRGFSNLEVVRACAAVTGREVEVAIGPRREGDPAMLVASNVRAEAELGWVPVCAELRTIVEDAWRWHSTHPQGYGAGSE